MQETHERSIIFAICEDNSCHCFGKYAEGQVGDDILGEYKVGHESGSYCHTPEESKCNGFLSYMPDCYSLQSYLKGEPNAEYGKIGEIIELKSKIKEFYMLLTDFFYKDVFYIWKITESNIDLLNSEEESTTNIYNLILREMLLQEFE